MREQTVAMYCVFDDLLRLSRLTDPSFGPAPDRCLGADDGLGDRPLFRRQPGRSYALYGTVLRLELAGRE